MWTAGALRIAAGTALPIVDQHLARAPVRLMSGTDHTAPGDEALRGTPGTGENLCRECNGTGVVDHKPCPACEGSGKVVQGVGGA